jgi:hypothetical protein
LVNLLISFAASIFKLKSSDWINSSARQTAAEGEGGVSVLEEEVE